MTDHTSNPTIAAYPPTQTELTALRRHVQELRRQGGTCRSITVTTGIGPMTVHDIAVRRQPTNHVAAALLAVTGTRLARARVDAGGTRLRLRALHVMGHGSARLARAAGASEQTIRTLVSGDARTISVQLRDTIIEVYDAWWDKRAPERTRTERAAACAARRRAIAGNWCAGAVLDDDELDIPGYKPGSRWRPALGTGVAADLPPARRKQLRAGA